jgi:hypothetical protein
VADHAKNDIARYSEISAADERVQHLRRKAAKKSNATPLRSSKERGNGSANETCMTGSDHSVVPSPVAEKRCRKRFILSASLTPTRSPRSRSLRSRMCLFRNNISFGIERLGGA